jgi:hypothetical protein
MQYARSLQISALWNARVLLVKDTMSLSGVQKSYFSSP